ncbi:hypothetical protein QQP08_014397 [Theobroma cacao]|nr:hypothetical protein QQP08_014397 [Theobroma cacao]
MGFDQKKKGEIYLAFVLMIILLKSNCCRAALLVKSNTTYQRNGRLDECRIAQDLELELDLPISSNVIRILQGGSGTVTGGTPNRNRPAQNNCPTAYGNCIANGGFVLKSLNTLSDDFIHEAWCAYIQMVMVITRKDIFTISGCLRLSNNLRSHTISLAVVAMALYSASVNDQETTDCFLDHHEMGDEPRKMMYPVVDFRVVGQPGQSTSQ